MDIDEAQEEFLSRPEGFRNVVLNEVLGEVNESTEADVILLSFGDSKIAIVKAVREATSGLSVYSVVRQLAAVSMQEVWI